MKKWGKRRKFKLKEIHKEIDLIQSCITRMAQNSFMVKGWFVSLYAVVLALLPEKINLFFVMYSIDNGESDVLVFRCIFP